MIRKTAYFEKRHVDLLARLARERGVTESQIVREAIDRLEASSLRVHDPDAVRKLIESMREIAGGPAQPGDGRGWTRDELYEERIGRWIRS